MGEARPATAVKLICGIIAAGEPAIAAATDELQKAFGMMDIESDVWPFDFTDYYEKEMGAGLLRKFAAFSRLVDPAELPDIKVRTNAMEKDVALRFPETARPVNLDPGYVCAGKIVLATTKDHSHRIYLRDGIYAEVTLIYRNGKFAHHDWTYPDYRTERYGLFLGEVRRKFMEQLRACG